MRQLVALLLLLVARPALATSGVLFFSGCETGSFTAGEEGSLIGSATACLSGGACCDTTAVRTGTYGLHIGSIANTTALSQTFTAVTTGNGSIYLRFYVKAVSAGNGGSEEPIFGIGRASAAVPPAVDYEVRIWDGFSIFQVGLWRTTTNIVSTTSGFSNAAFHLVELKITPDNSNDTYEFRFDNAVIGSGTTGIATGVTGISQIWPGRANNRHSATAEYYLDDWIVGTGGIGAGGFYGYGQTIARQGQNGTPQDNAFTESACTCQPATGTCQACANTTACCNISQTPVSATNQATSIGSNAQTVQIAPFNLAETNPTSHGAQVLGASSDNVNACRVVVDISKTSGGTITAAIRKYFNLVLSVDVGIGTLPSATTNFAYTDCCWSRTATSCSVAADCGGGGSICTGGVCTGLNSDLNTMEAGVSISANNRQLNLNDLWVMCDYQPQNQRPSVSKVWAE